VQHHFTVNFGIMGVDEAYDWQAQTRAS